MASKPVQRAVNQCLGYGSKYSSTMRNPAPPRAPELESCVLEVLRENQGSIAEVQYGEARAAAKRGASMAEAAYRKRTGKAPSYLRGLRLRKRRRR